MTKARTGRLLAGMVAAIFAFTQVPAAALADGRGHGRHKGGYDRHHHGDYQKHRGHQRHGGYNKHRGRDYHRRGVVVVRPGHRRHHDYRPHYRPYAYKPAHRHYRGHRDRDDAFVLIGLGLATVGLFAILNQSQQQAHHRSQVYATTAPVGRTITWNDGNARGSTVVTRDGRDRAGRYCREYQHTVVVAGRQQQAWGTACQQPDGDWQIVE